MQELDFEYDACLRLILNICESVVQFGPWPPILSNDGAKRRHQPAEVQSTPRSNVMANPFVHVELNTTDVSKAKAFYGKLFDWKLEDVPMDNGAYTMINVGDGTGGGMMKQLVPGAPSSWLAYVLVDDIATATAKAKSLGATVMKDVTEVMGMGSLSIIVDPTGACY
jgi:predicted enzyme related to lactoylglutathione lyase